MITCKKKVVQEKVCVGVFRWKRFDSIYMLRRKSVEREREKIFRTKVEGILGVGGRVLLKQGNR